MSAGHRSISSAGAEAQQGRRPASCGDPRRRRRRRIDSGLQLVAGAAAASHLL